jgi:glutamate carboxypeptidase
MEKSAATARLVDLAVAIGAELGFEVHDATTGGASDANTTAAAGVPTLDGLGPIGGDDHAPPEWLDLASVAPRTTLLAGLIARVGEAL